MKLFAAIDLKNGKCVRLVQGDPKQKTVYSDDPVATAKHWESEGADWIHIVNLDGALNNPEKSAKNIEAVQAILEAVEVPVQFGSGLRTMEEVKRALDWGVSRVVIGSTAAEEPDTMIAMLDRFGPERIVLGLDVREGKIATHGWQQTSTVNAIDMLRSFHEAGLAHVVHTDIARDGMLSGANVEASVALVQAGTPPGAGHRFRVIVSGGVTSVEDIRRGKAAKADGIEGLIIGKALYDGRIDLKEALEAARADA